MAKRRERKTPRFHITLNAMGDQAVPKWLLIEISMIKDELRASDGSTGPGMVEERVTISLL